MAGGARGGEEDIIQRHFAPLAAGFPGAFGLTDDAAAFEIPPGRDLVVTTDAVVEGVHFLPGEDPARIAWKALAVNVSDLVAKGAAPLAYMMAVAFPARPSEAWLEGFARGWRAAQEAFGCHLAGGDTDRAPGPLAVSVTAFGVVPAGAMVRRATASAGDAVYVTGTIGDAALGLRLRRDPALGAAWGLDPAAVASLEARYMTPFPVQGFGDILRAHASASIDISDGLAKDFDRLRRASGAGGRIELERIPLSAPARAVLGAGGATLADLITGGEDYEILIAVPEARGPAFERAARDHGTQATRVGALTDERRIVVAGGDGRPLDLPCLGWDHF